ncbi:hypothetical protein LVR53_21445, partial [Klebsiella pneumoniae]|nr:hypothetical protein [Klebsiella pneumoniae]MCD9714339.1 hypothetical protein [Klebsiella pneumoniae]
WLMMSLWDALRMNMMISYQELVRTFPGGQQATFLKTVTPTQARNFIGQNYGLTLKNINDDNSTSYSINSGRKIRFVLPANPDATTTTPYSVEMEVL